MSTRLPADLHEWLRREAFDLREPMNSIVVAALEERRARNGARGRWVFHKDGDPLNNDPSNLELKDADVAGTANREMHARLRGALTPETTQEGPDND